MKRFRNILLLFLSAFITVFCFSFAAAEEIGLQSLLTGNIDSPICISVSSPQWKNLAQFGSGRLESLNMLLKHFSVDVSVDGSFSETAISVDNEPLFSVAEEKENGNTRSVYSFSPDLMLEYSTESGKEEEKSFSAFLDVQFFMINRMMDEFYPMFEKTAEQFQERAKTEGANLNFSGYGKGVKRTTIQLSADYVNEQFPKVLSGLAPSDESSQFIRGLIFSGPQKIILLYDAADRLLRINYDGVVGISDESMRKVSVVWRCVRTENHTKDHLTLKTPSLKGSDRYNLVFVRDLDLSDPEKHVLNWDFQLDLKAGEERKKIQYNADLIFKENCLNGKVLYSSKENGVEQKLSVLPEIRRENTAEYTGTLEITSKTGKITVSSMSCNLHISPCERLKKSGETAKHVVDSGSDEGAAVLESLQNRMQQLLVSRLMALPASDLSFLSSDIPEDIWNSLVQSIK